MTWFFAGTGAPLYLQTSDHNPFGSRTNLVIVEISRGHAVNGGPAWIRVGRGGGGGERGWVECSYGVGEGGVWVEGVFNVHGVVVTRQKFPVHMWAF